MIGILGFIFIIGLIIGSFLNVVILRTVSGESIVFPGSKCPKCQTSLKWYHNIPLFSYIFLRGKCAFCHEKISIQYPLVELFTATIFTILGYLYLSNIINAPETMSIFILMYLTSIISVSLFIAISGTDIIEMQVSDKHTFLLIGLGLLYSIIIGSINFYSDYKFGFLKWDLFFIPVLYTIAATIIAFVLMEILRRISGYLIKAETFGDGDSYIYAGITAVIAPLFGAKNFTYIAIILLVLLLLSIIVAVIFSLPFYIKNIIKSKNWFLLCTLAAFIIYTTIHLYGINAYWFYNTLMFVTSTSILVLLGITLCVEMILSIKRKENNGGTQIPFGPWLCTSGLVLLLALPVFLALG